jgi:hypothetical protein
MALMIILITGFLFTSLLCTVVIIGACVVHGRTVPYESPEAQVKDYRAIEYHQETRPNRDRIVRDDREVAEFWS